MYLRFGVIKIENEGQISGFLKKERVNFDKKY
jgi:hypothetical protein